MEFNLIDNKVTKTIQQKLGSILCFLIIIGNILFRFLAVTEFSLSALANISAEVVIYILSIWMIYLLSQASGIKAGKATEVYKTTMEKYYSVRVATRCLLDKLSAWCKSYVLEDIERRRTDILVPNDVSFQDYQEKYKGRSRRYLRKQGLIKWQIKAIKKADRLKPYRLTATKLLTSHEVDTKDNHAPHPSAEVTRNTTSHLTKYTVFSIFIINAAFVATRDTDFQSVIVEVLIRTISLLSAFYSGYQSGYKNQTVTAVNYTNEQTDMLTLFNQNA